MVTFTELADFPMTFVYGNMETHFCDVKYSQFSLLLHGALVKI